MLALLAKCEVDSCLLAAINWDAGLVSRLSAVMLQSAAGTTDRKRRSFIMFDMLVRTII